MGGFTGLRLAQALILLAGAAWADAGSETPLSVAGKFRYHAGETASPAFLAQTAAYAGVLQWMDTPAEWGQGARTYGKRAASAGGATAIRNLFAFALDSALREDPRYRRGTGGFLSRIGHAAGETVITRNDAGRRRFATWRFGSAVGAACLSNVWYPDRLNTFSSGMEQAAATIGLDLLGNLAGEFWPDLKRIVFRRH